MSSNPVHGEHLHEIIIILFLYAQVQFVTMFSKETNIRGQGYGG
jgi:hypothetical protein